MDEAAALAFDREMLFADLEPVIDSIMAAGYWKLLLVTDGGGAPGARGGPLAFQPKDAPRSPSGLDVELFLRGTEPFLGIEGVEYSLSSDSARAADLFDESADHGVAMRVDGSVPWQAVVDACHALPAVAFRLD